MLVISIYGPRGPPNPHAHRRFSCADSARLLLRPVTHALLYWWVVVWYSQGGRCGSGVGFQGPVLHSGCQGVPPAVVALGT